MIRKITAEQAKEIVSLVTARKRVADIAKIFNVHQQTIYYTLKKLKLSIKEIKRPKVKKHIPVKYYTYVNLEYKRGSITKKERTKALNRYYNNRKNTYLTEHTIVEKESAL